MEILDQKDETTKVLNTINPGVKPLLNINKSAEKTVKSLGAGSLALFAEYLLIKKFAPDVYSIVEPGVISVSLTSVFIGLSNLVKHYFKK